MQRFLNIIHYKLFIWFKFIDKVTNYINPFRWFTLIPAVKKFHKKRGIQDFNKLMDEEVFNHKVTGFNITYAGFTIGGLLGLIMFSLFNLLQIILQKPLLPYVWETMFVRILFVISLCLIPWKICDKLIFNDDKYLGYFKEFEKQSKTWKKKWSLFSLLFIIGVILFFALTLYWFTFI
jgi:hypothetical protein